MVMILSVTRLVKVDRGDRCRRSHNDYDVYSVTDNADDKTDL